MNLKEKLAKAVQREGNNTALRFKRDGEWVTLGYRRLQTRIWQAAELLGSIGVEPGDRVGILLDNVPEWPEIYFAVVGLGATAVPLDIKLQEQEVAHILRNSGARAVFLDAAVYPLVRDIEDRLPKLEAVIILGDRKRMPAGTSRIACKHYESELRQNQDAALSDSRRYDRENPGEDDIASLIYTSGTTGRPKGAMLTHRNFVANVESCINMIGILPDDNFMLVLPLHHSFAFTTNMLLPLLGGCEISYVESLRTVAPDVSEARPTILIGVPLLLEKMYTRINSTISGKPVARWMLRLGLGKAVGRGVAKKLGGRLRLMVSGGAPCPLNVLRGWNRLGFLLLEGYGLTETAPVVSFNPPEGPKPGTVGKPLPGVEIRINDPNEDGIGEILIKGPNVMKGYYRNPEATEEVLRDGWFYTGDLGFIDDDGYLTIAGRMKNMIVNREGKNIYPEELEHEINKHPLILEAIALGYRPPHDDNGERVGVLAVPDQEGFAALGSEQERDFSDAEIEQKTIEAVREQCQALAKYKRPRCIQVQFEEFEKTSTQKVKRYLYAINTAPMKNPPDS